ncbi:hypothetical protein FIBSPDRAFT_858228 [Athelia psychrophila]|uniref:Uncharacterized protein n=1 Tax=Athelia psychrophila TaxID=1759441 RepID=A0A167TW08_9AGAM|nr:hypothetical protein FIBSPDRAFT_879554 [Fibularhizoctonia sp. CBS 109695]KZP23657.1 hypothetical protein FIBSPDRAFT_858228 [Fibularhizoctonia sp. CBS 109695]
MDELIRVTPKLKTLDIHNDIHALVAYRESRDYSRFVKALTATCGTGLYPAPELQTLLLDYWKGFRVRLFVDMVESRWRVDSSGGSVKRINSVRLRRVPDAAIFNAVAMERLREFAAEGLTIEVEVVTRDYVSNGEYEHQLIVFEEGLSDL